MNNFDPNYKEEPVVARVGQKAIVFNSENEILILRRSDKTDRAGGWDFPGGRLEFGEDPTEGIKREILEEAGLEVTDLKPIYVHSYTNKKDDYVIIIGYQARALSEKVQISWEHDLYKWMTKDEVANLELPEAHRVFLKRLGI